MASQSSETEKVPIFTKFLIGGIAGMVGQLATHPMDVIKLRMQTSTKSMSHIFKESLQTKGFRNLYIGLTASLLRQLTYSTTRLGLYQQIVETIKQYTNTPTYATFIGVGMLSGILGSLVGTPSDLVMIRMITDSTLPPHKQRKYKNAITALLKIWKNEGIRALWRGAVPTMGRAAIVNGIQLGTYSKVKMVLLDAGYFNDDLLLQSVSSMISGLAMCTISLPVDAAKTKIMHWQGPVKPPGLIGMIFQIRRNEGVFALWRGFFPYYARAGPNIILTMVSAEQLQRIYLKYIKGN